MDLLLVDVHVDDRRPMAARGPAEPRELEARSDSEQEVRLPPEAISRRAAEAERAVVGDDSASAAEGHYGSLQELGELAYLGGSRDGSPAHHDHRPLRGAEELQRLLDRVGIRIEWRTGRWEWRLVEGDL